MVKSDEWLLMVCQGERSAVACDDDLKQKKTRNL